MEEKSQNRWEEFMFSRAAATIIPEPLIIFQIHWKNVYFFLNVETLKNGYKVPEFKG